MWRAGAADGPSLVDCEARQEAGQGITVSPWMKKVHTPCIYVPPPHWRVLRAQQRVLSYSSSFTALGVNTSFARSQARESEILRSMATEALAAYTAGKYIEALSHLSHLSVATKNSSSAVGGGVGDASSSDTYSTGEFRTQHNRALSEHGARGFTDPATLEATLRSIQSRLAGGSGGGGGGGSSGGGAGGGGSNNSDADAEDSDDNTTPTQRGGGAVSGARRSSRAWTGSLVVGTSGGARAAAAAAASLADLDADASVLLYNLSALRFQQKQYGAAQAVLERLFLHIEPLDDNLAIHICLLLLDVLCHSARGNLHTGDNLRRFAAQTAAVLAFLERPHALNSSSGGGDR